MTETSRTINHKLNDLLAKPTTLAKPKLPPHLALEYSSLLKTNILGKDKQEKVNSIVVLAKLLDQAAASDSQCASADFANILDDTLWCSLFAIVSAKMSSETYKAILKTMMISLSGSLFPTPSEISSNTFDFSPHPGSFRSSSPPSYNSAFNFHLPLYRSLVAYLDVVDAMSAKLVSADLKILSMSIRVVYDLIARALDAKYDGIITITGRLKHTKFFSTTVSVVDPSDANIMDAVARLEAVYYRLNMYLSNTSFDLLSESHRIMMNNLFTFLDVALNETKTPASTAEYVKAGFTEDPRGFVANNFSILLAMDLKIFLKDPNMTFEKRFHEELIMSDHNRTFPLHYFISACTDIWLRIFNNKKKYPRLNTHILSWELMIYYSMTNCLLLWEDTRAQLDHPEDLDAIPQLLEANIGFLESSLTADPNIEDALDEFYKRDSHQIRHTQFLNFKSRHESLWAPHFKQFDSTLSKEVMEFVCEQRVMQLLKGSWVLTEGHAEQVFLNVKGASDNSYYFIMLSPNRKSILYKYYSEKPTLKPSLEEMEQNHVDLNNISQYTSVKVGLALGEEDKANNSMLISVKGSISYEKICLLDRVGKPLLTFFTDSEVEKAVWLDGLKMLKGSVSHSELSKETAQQLESLQEIRKNTQMLVLQDSFYDEKAREDPDTDEEFYDFAELTAVSEGFHYAKGS